MLNCTYTDPKQVKDIGGHVYQMVDPYDQGRAVVYSKSNCTGDLGGSTSTLPNIYEQITDPNSGKTFFLEKSISYGSALTTFFILVLITILVANFIFKIIVKRN
jgi:hypothetical protein